jgi:hypothetical protein
LLLSLAPINHARSSRRKFGYSDTDSLPLYDYTGLPELAQPVHQSSEAICSDTENLHEITSLHISYHEEANAIQEISLTNAALRGIGGYHLNAESDEVPPYDESPNEKPQLMKQNASMQDDYHPDCNTPPISSSTIVHFSSGILRSNAVASQNNVSANDSSSDVCPGDDANNEGQCLYAKN